MTVLEKAKEVERSTSYNHYLTIRLTLLQDLIAEIERLQHAAPQTAIKGIAVVREKAAERQEDKS